MHTWSEIRGHVRFNLVGHQDSSLVNNILGQYIAFFWWISINVLIFFPTSHWITFHSTHLGVVLVQTSYMSQCHFVVKSPGSGVNMNGFRNKLDHLAYLRHLFLNSFICKMRDLNTWWTWGGIIEVTYNAPISGKYVIYNKPSANVLLLFLCSSKETIWSHAGCNMCSYIISTKAKVHICLSYLALPKISLLFC